MSKTLGLFEGVGVEIEYMIVDAKTLEALPVADRVLAQEAGEIVGEVEAGPLCWSNELALHVIELKTNGPAPSIAGINGCFEEGISRINAHLAPLGGQLMPSSMHPWFNPEKETRLWPHGHSPIYQAYNRIFGCQGHGWSNLQSTHLNLPFCGDAEFSRLHAAIRLILPLLPALAASSPVFEGKMGPALDNRLQVYQTNQAKIPPITGKVIPEAAFSRKEYQRQILDPIYAAIAPHDEQAILQHEWLNSRGAIARFERSAIEIRLLDVQECASADLAVATLIIAVLRALVKEEFGSLKEQQRWHEGPLAELFHKCVKEGEKAVIDQVDYLALFNYPGSQATAQEVWRHLAEAVLPGEKNAPLELILSQGPLARRMERVLGREPKKEALQEVYGELCRCLSAGELFKGEK